MRQTPNPDKQPSRRISRFVSLRWKVFFHLSLLIVALTGTFGLLNYLYLRQQFDAQLKARFTTIEQEMHGLLKRSTDRLQRLGSVVAMWVDPSQARLPDQEHLARLTALSYELDLQSIEWFGTEGQLLWQWPQDQAPAAGIAPLVSRVLASEAPVTVLSCHPGCELRALAPILAQGRNAGAIGITQSIADLILDFQAITGSNTDLGIFVQDQSQANPEAPWGWPAALTNRQALAPFLGHLARRYPDLDKLGNGVFVSWRKSTYAIHRIQLWELIEAPRGWIVLFSDVSEAFAKIQQATVSVLLEAGSIAVVGELLLLLLIRAPTKRLQRLANTLPLLALGRYTDARAALASKRQKIDLYDEIDVLETTATTLSYQLESQAEALAIKNRELADERDFIRGLLNAAHVIIVTQTQTGIIKTVNEHGVRLTGFSPAELYNQPFTFLLHHANAAEDLLAWLQKPAGEGDFQFQHEIEIRCRDGTLRDIVWVHTRLKETHSSQIAVLSVGLDVTDRVRAEARLAWLATHDPLTGLFNRHRFQEELERTVAELSRSQRSCALVLFDLDNFKDINDSSGHAAGDALLKMLAKLLKERARSSDTVARLGGDEFAVLMADTTVFGAETFARGLNERLLETPFHYAGKTYRISASVGIAMIPHHGSNVEDLMANADLAMYQAKQSGRGRFHTFSFEDQTREGAEKRVYWKEVIIRALEHKRFLFHFQPIADAVSQAIVYHEALLRLCQEDGTLILPGVFIDAAQRSGIISAIDRFVVEEALRVLKENAARGLKPVLAINLSANALADTQWTEPLRTEVKAGRLNPRQILFEVTETAAVADVAAARKVMEAMSALGFQFAIDDFGAGFASFHYLKHLPFTYVKIDKSFTSKLATDLGDRAFVQAIVTLAHGYGQKVVAEGVEDEAILQLLRELGVDYVQGFHIGRPDNQMATGLVIIQC